MNSVLQDQPITPATEQWEFEQEIASHPADETTPDQLADQLDATDRTVRNLTTRATEKLAIAARRDPALREALEEDPKLLKAQLAQVWAPNWVAARAIRFLLARRGIRVTGDVAWDLVPEVTGSRSSTCRGFTLIELVAAIALIACLCVVGLYLLKR